MNPYSKRVVFSICGARIRQMSKRHVIVIGGGVIGAACAYYLARSDWQVTVLDRGGFGMGCSHANCGVICPSHLLPLAEPGATWKALKSLFQKNSPFYIKPRFDPAMWRWLWNFSRRCNMPDLMEAAHACKLLLESSRQLYDELLTTEPMECEWEARGLLFVYESRPEMDEYAKTDRLLGDSFGMPAVRYNGDAVVKLEPALKSGLAGGWYYEHDAHLRPDKLMDSWRRLLEKHGIVIREQCEVTGFVGDAGQARAAITHGGELAADAFVVAAGALTPLLSKSLGCRIPIQPGKGYSITMPRPARCPVIPIIFPETRVAVTPMQSGYRLGSTMEFAGYDDSLNRRRLDLLRDGVKAFLHEPYCEPVQEEWFGWRPMTYDGKPIIDRSPALDNVVIAAGHNMLGVSMSPGTGRLVAELLNGAAPHIDPKPFTVRRF
jgi:D-amino-acid dehydrogenase